MSKHGFTRRLRNHKTYRRSIFDQLVIEQCGVLHMAGVVELEHNVVHPAVAVIQDVKFIGVGRMKL